MKVLFVQAAAFSPETERSMPLGVLSLAAYLRDRHRADVRVFDMQLRVKTADPAVAFANAFRPDLIGISGLTPDGRMIDTLSRKLKTELPEVPIVVGGAHATNYAAQVLENSSIDYLVENEGELALGALTEHLEGGRDRGEVPNLAFRTKGSVHRSAQAPFIEDLDSLPFPAYDLIDLEPYYRIPRCGVIYSRRRYAAIITSRGCPYRCAYCHQNMGKTWRPRSAVNVVDEMESLMHRFHIGDFVFMDDMFNLTPERINRLARLIVDRGLDVGLSFPIGLRGDIMTEESVKLLKEAGMYRCMYAIESASDRIQKMIFKNNRLDKLLHIIDVTRRHGVMVHGSFMLGFPTETEGEARATVDFAMQSRLHTAAFYRVIPFKGTALHRIATEAGAEIPEDTDGYEFHKSRAVNVSDMPDEVITRLRRRAYRIFYLSPGRLWGIWTALPNRWRTLPTLAMIWVRKAFVW